MRRLHRVAARIFASVRVRVTAAALLAVAAALVGGIIIVDARLQHDRQRVLVATATEQGREVADYNKGKFTSPILLPQDASIQSGGLVQIIRDGRVLAASRQLNGLPPLWSPGDPEVQTNYVQIGTGQDVHVVTVPIPPPPHVKPTYIAIVTSLDQYDRSVQEIERLLDYGMPLLLAVVGLICWFVVGRALRPIELMRREVAEVATTRGHHRVVEPAPDDEVGRLARTLNSMLDRIEASSERERRFVADASHELRSPIANIRTAVEVALHHPERADWRSLAEEVLSQNGRMDRLVDELLLLARSDEGGLMPASTPTDLAAVAEEVVGAYASSAPWVTLRSVPAYVTVPGGYLERMLGNLIDNARRFAATAVSVTVGRDDSYSYVSVRDDGPGIPEADRARIFERFVRLDEARDRDEGGFGLGLAIVSDLCRFYGGRVEVGDAHPGAVFTLRFPAAAAAPAAPVAEPAPV